jgi:hypothetical protein
MRHSFIFFAFHLFIKRKSWVFSRTACLGNDTYYRLVEENYGTTLRLNLQKNRVDNLNGNIRARRIGLKGFRILDRKDILEVIWIQNLRFWRLLPTPKYILMDSFSELTDQLFVFEEGKATFFANYSDVEESYLQKRKIVSLDLLDINQISDQYKLFFDHIYSIWGNRKNQFNIYFIHFAHKFESREFFKFRAKEIQNAIDELALTYSNLISIKIPEDLVKQQINKDGILDAFPYHFDESAAKYVAQEIKKYETAINGKI